MLRRYTKGIALLLLLTFGQEIFLPTTVWALTGGPSQPEVNSFEPVGTNQMVDLSTGDFNYNIPLMVVPGPNGGYPINLAYHAGIGMEQEASWVGLGWNINPGAITRNLRGVPDDFSGDEIVKRTNMKPDVTAGLSLHLDQVVNPLGEFENFGYKPSEAIAKSSSLKVYFNNYRGVGYSAVISNSQFLHKQASCGLKYDRLFNLGAVLSFDSNSGLGIDLSPSLSRDYRGNDNNWRLRGFNIGIGLNSRQGLTNLRFGHIAPRATDFSTGSNISFANQTYVPGSNNSMFGTNSLLGLTISDKDVLKETKKAKTIRGELTTNSLAETELSLSSYGTIYLENDVVASPGDRYNSMVDVNVYNDLPINKRSVYMGFPLMTADLYSISGQGIGGVFRANRNDIASLYETGNTSNTIQVSGSLESATGFFSPPDPVLHPIETALGVFSTSLQGLGWDANLGYHRSYSGKWNIKYVEKLKLTERLLTLGIEFGISEDIAILIDMILSFDNLDDESDQIIEDFIDELPTTELVREEIREEIAVLQIATDALGFKFQDRSSQTPLTENFYFKVAGEKTAIYAGEWDYMQNEDPIAFDMDLIWTGKSPKPFTKGNIIGSGSGGRLTARENKERFKRIQNIEYKTKGELVNSEGYSDRPSYLYNVAENPIFDAGLPIQHNLIDGTEADIDHHIQEFSILRPDGSRYTYGLPAYNTHHEENVFANTSGAESDGISKYEDSDLVTYTTDDASIENDEGVDHYFAGTEIPSYAHANLLTQITSADYVDVTGNGVSEDDFGFYAKFNYTQVSDYKWRDPYFGADYIKGFYSNERDDKATFSYGSKNLFYTHSIETKTHVAIFELGDRADGIGADNGITDDFGRNRGESDDFLPEQRQHYLKSIKLYSKKEFIESVDAGLIPVPLQTVDFEYSYELCPGVFNNDGTIDDPDDFDLEPGVDQTGKLTLKRVYISYNGNEKGRLSPYEFDYGFNPGYARLDIDRWGNYQSVLDGDDDFENVINPYTRQDEDDANLHAEAWNLTQVNLPSGGQINVDYESDNYGYVQDKRAAQMIEIVGFTETDDDTWSGGSSSLKLKKKNLRLWFKADKLEGEPEANRDEIIGDYLEGLDEIYFKVFQNLKQPYDLSDDMAEDYVEGYAEIDPAGNFGADELDGNFGYVDLKSAEYKSVGLSLFKAHPFRKAGWQYLRYSRSDLFNDQGTYDDFAEGAGDALLSIPLTLVSLLKETLSVLSLGQYNQYSILGYCKTISTRKKSFVRLNSPNKLKYGGGHRVSSVSLSDNWVEGEREFGTAYEYKNIDGTTSGVADYEPIVGGEENALKKPLRFNGNGQLINFQHQDIYIEEPISEAVYPGARVVYGRVLVKNLDNTGASINVNESQNGITINEFYTAKDFPVKTRIGNLEKTKGFTLPIYIPFLGFQSVNNRGYSQGYTVITNDMSGRPKAVSTYPYRDGEISGLPISEVKYKYKTDELGGLNNLVDVLDHHGVTRKAILGVEQDLTIFEEENNGYTESLGFESGIDIQVNVVGSPPVPVLIPVPNYKMTANHAESMYRGISTSKIIRKSGILEEVEVFSDGSRITTKNILFDAETGEALLTTVNNEWDKPVYNYNYAAHWNFDAMGGAYKNYRANIYFEGSANEFTLYAGEDGEVIPASEVLVPGDEITVDDGGTYRTYYVTSITGSEFDLQDKAGTSYPLTPGTEGTITRSGRRNLQSVKSGSVVALSDQFLYASSDFSGPLLAWNASVTGADPQEGEGSPDDDAPYIDANTGLESTYDWYQDQIFVPNAYRCQTEDYLNFYLQINFAAYSSNQINFSGADPGVFLGTLDFTGDSPMGIHIVPTTMDDASTSYTEQLVEFKVIEETYNESGETETVTILHLPSGDTFTGTYTSNPNPWSQRCKVSDILHSDAIVFEDEWEYPYADVGNPEVFLGTNISDASINPYRYGKKGIWRAKKTFLYQIDRKQSGVTPRNTRNNIDGEYEPWEPYSWLEGNLNPKWDWVSEITMYSPYGFAVEEKSRLNNMADDDMTALEENSIYSSQMYGYDNSVVIATSALASYYEIGYTGFEQAVAASNPNNFGHLNLTSTGTYAVSVEKSHTGTNSLKVENFDVIEFKPDYTEVGSPPLQGIAGKDYVVSLWVNLEESLSAGTLKYVKDGIVQKSVTTADGGEIIDGWKKLELKFTMPASGVVDIQYASTGKTYIDDLRIGPYDGGMVTYVYDRGNLWLMAELDGLNYATFYNYDEEGNLVQVKKETEDGIVTVQTARSNTVQN